MDHWNNFFFLLFFWNNFELRPCIKSGYQSLWCISDLKTNLRSNKFSGANHCLHLWKKNYWNIHKLQTIPSLLFEAAMPFQSQWSWLSARHAQSGQCFLAEQWTLFHWDYSLNTFCETQRSVCISKNYIEKGQEWFFDDMDKKTAEAFPWLAQWKLSVHTNTNKL